MRRPVRGQSVFSCVTGVYESLGKRKLKAGIGIRIDYDLAGGETIHAAAVPAQVRSSFGFKGFTTVDDRVYMMIYGGYVSYSRRFHTRLADSEDSPESLLHHVEISGTFDVPTVVCVQMHKTSNALSYVGMPEPSDNGTYWFYRLHEAYLTEAGVPVYLGSRREDWRLGSPIK